MEAGEEATVAVAEATAGEAVETGEETMVSCSLLPGGLLWPGYEVAVDLLSNIIAMVLPFRHTRSLLIIKLV